MNKKHKLAVGFMSAAILVSATALAGTWSNTDARLELIEVDSTGTAPQTYVGFTTTPTGKPACATQSVGVLFGSAEGIKTMTVIANSALLAGRNVQVYWDGTCTSSYGRIAAIRMR
jgi:hypothetical protein